MSSNAAPAETEAYLSIGSNIGDRIGYLKKSIKSISMLSRCGELRVSSVYESQPVGYTDQPNFLNAAAVVSTPIGAVELLHRLKLLERELGRTPRERWRAREIDIDVIFYGRSRIETDDLNVPHPRAHLRRFVLQPLCELSPDFVHPLLNKTIKQLLEDCSDGTNVTLFASPSVLRG